MFLFSPDGDKRDSQQRYPPRRAYQPSAFAIRDFYTYSTSVISCKQFANTFSFCLTSLTENIIKLVGAMGSFGALEQLYGMMYRETKIGQIEVYSSRIGHCIYFFNILEGQV